MYVERDVDLDGDVPTHGADASAIGILQTAEMGLIGLVEEVLTGDAELDAIVTKGVNVSAEREVADGIVRGGCLGVLKGEVMILPEVILHAEGDVRASQMASEDVGQFAAQFQVPAWRRDHGQVVHVRVGLVQLGASHVAE